MAAVLARFRTDLRAGWRVWLSIAMLAGLSGGVAVAAAAGARRTETAYPRFLRSQRGYDGFVASTEGTDPGFDFGAVQRLPAVKEAARVSYYVAAGETKGGRPLRPDTVAVYASPDGRYGSEVNRLKVVKGRLPDPTSLDEVATSFLAASQLDLHVGDSFEMAVFGPEVGQVIAEGGVASLFTKPRRPFHVVGVVAAPGDFPPLATTANIQAPLYLSPAFGRAVPGLDDVGVRLVHGRQDMPAFQRALERAPGGTTVHVVTEEEQTTLVMRALAVRATTLRVLAATVALVTLLLVGQALGRRNLLESGEYGTLRALGMTRPQLAGVAMGKSVFVASVAAVVAGGTAVAASALTPVDVARSAEPHPGIELNLAYLGAGALLIVVLLLVLGALSAWVTAGRAGTGTGQAAARTAGRQPSRTTATLSAAGLSAPAVTGMRMALEPGRGPTAVPLRTTVVGVSMSLAIVAASLVFAGSLSHLLDSPALYGWSWDVQVGNGYRNDFGPEAADGLVKSDAFSAVSLGTSARLQVNHHLVDTLAIDPLEGSITPTVVDGRAPYAPDEMLLGAKTMRKLGIGIGDTVPVELAGRSSRMRIVGKGVLTDFSGGARLGEGASMTFAGLRPLLPSTPRNIVLLRFAPGVDQEAVYRDLAAHFGDAGLIRPSKPVDLANLQRVGGMPLVLAALLAAMGVATLAHTMLTSVRRRRRDLAILKTLGFTRRQISVTVAWQATTLGLMAVIVGLPLGLALGRWAWALFADQLGIPAEPVTPLLGLLVLGATTVGLANLIATVPARVAAGTQPAVVLRSE